MTEQEFDSQVWRRFDVVTTDTGIETTVMNICFSTRSVRIFVKNAPPEWLPAKRIEKHTTRKGGDADDLTIIEESKKLGLGRPLSVNLCNNADQMTDNELYDNGTWNYKPTALVDLLWNMHCNPQLIRE